MPLTSAFTGFFFKANRPPLQTTTLVDVCLDHGALCASTPVCPLCGKKTVRQVVMFCDSLKSIGEVVSDVESEWVKQMAPEDVALIQEQVTFIETKLIDGEEDYDYFFVGPPSSYLTVSIFHNIETCDPTDITTPPDQQLVDRIIKAVGYHSWSMHFGTMIIM